MNRLLEISVSRPFQVLPMWFFVGLLMGCLVLSPFVQAQEFDMGIEEEASFADSEAAIAEAAEAQRRAELEKQRLAAEKKKAQEEIERARGVEADAKAKLAKFLSEEAKLKALREKEEAKTKAAQEKIQALNTKVQAKELELAAFREVVDRAVAETAQAEKQVAEMEARAQELKMQMAAEEQRRLENKTRAALVKGRMDALKTPASVNKAGKGKAGWVTVKKDCSMHPKADSASQELLSVKAGERVYGRRSGADWIQAKAKTGRSGFLPIACFR